MVTITIDHQQIAVDEQLTILEAAKEAHIEIPHLCYLRDINEIGACRVCVVELQGKDKLVTACNTVVQEGMVIYTNSPKVRYARRCNVELLLSQHDCECAYCSRSGNCSLQKISNDLGITSLPYEKKVMYTPWNQSFPLIRESNKCIKCMRCIQICDKVQNLQVWDVQNTGSRTTVNVSLNRSIEEAECSLCGQCITHCPVNALHVREDSERAFAAFNDPDKITIVQIAPAVRAAWGESLGLRREEATIEKLGDAFRRMGADYVFDTDFAADLTIMEEASEFLERLHHNKEQEMPMFTSCCPGWVRFLKSQYPDMVSHLSTSKSPHQMFGAVTKTWFAEKLGVDPSSIYNISVMPCVAKKHEIDIPVMNDSGYRDVEIAVSLILCIAVVLFLNPLTALFGISDAIFEGAKTAILITTVSFPFLGITRVTSAIFYATEKTRNSTFLVYMEPCLLLPLSLFALSFLFQLNGIWMAYPAAQLILCGIALFMKNPLHAPAALPQTQEQTLC